MEKNAPQTGEGPGEPEREGISVEEGGPDVHTTPEEGHPAGEGERSDRDIGGPTSPDDDTAEDATGGAPGSSPESGFEPHEAEDAPADEDD